jgi:hypothetical protein
MVSVTEIANQQSALASAIRQGLESIDRDQKVKFTRYTKKVLPLDGYVFWIKSGKTISVDGSLHYSVDERQEETETVALNHIIFTSEQEVQEFNAIAPDTIWIGSLGNAAASAGDPVEGISSLTPFPVLFAFSGRGNFYKAAEVYHYRGTAILPAMMSQIVNSVADLPDSPIVTNSLPIWLSQTQFGTVYPSFLVPNNVEPPYIVAHIEPEETDFIQAFPTYDMRVTGASAAVGFFQVGVSEIGQSNLSYGVEVPNSGASPLYQLPSCQLMQDHVRLTLVGFNNQTALQFYVSLIEFSRNTDAFGFMNSPAIRDEKRTQVEMSILQQKKHIDITASYYQSTANVIAERLILSACASLEIA